MANGFEAFPGQQSEREAAKSEGESPGLQLLDSRIMAQDAAEGESDFESPDPNMATVGDFRAVRGDVDAAYRKHQERSGRARDVDNQNRAPITTDFSTWKSAPDRFDYPGVDTPTQDPKTKPKDFKKGGKPKTTEVDEEREVGSGRQSRGPDLMREIGGERMYSEEVAEEGPEGTVPGVAPEDFEQEPALPGFDSEAKRMGPDPSSQRLPQGVRDNLAAGESADLAFSKAERQRKRERQSGRDVPMQPYETRNSGPPSQIGPYELITDTQEGDMRTIAFEEPERERTVAFQRSNPDLEGPDASVDVWWGDNAETVFEGGPNEAFETFIGELEQRAERNKQRTGNESNIQSPEEERIEAMANLFGV